jgi:hypothetical protein
MKKLFFLLLVSSIATSLNAQQSNPSSTTINEQELQRKRDSSQKEFIIVILKEVFITSATSSKNSEGLPALTALTKESISTTIKGLKIENGKVVALDGYKFISSTDEKSVSLQKISTTGLSSIAGTFEYTCFGNSNSCKVTINDSRTIILSTGCVGCSLVATINNTKYLVRLN